MLFKPEYDENGKKILCEMNGINSEMLMDIYVNAAREKILLKKSLTQFIFANRLRRVLPQTRTAKCLFK